MFSDKVLALARGACTRAERDDQKKPNAQSIWTFLGCHPFSQTILATAQWQAQQKTNEHKSTMAGTTKKLTAQLAIAVLQSSII